MPVLKLVEVLSYSSEDPNNPADNLLKPDTYLKWKSKPNGTDRSSQEYIILKLEKLSSICSIDIGNEHSAFVEVLAGRENADYQVLLVASSFMTPLESRNSENVNRVRLFGPDKLNKNISEQKWDRLKIICTQPFNKKTQYGLTFIKVYAPENKEKSKPESQLGKFTLMDEEENSFSIGQFFEKRKERDSTSLAGAAAIRAVSKSLNDENIKSSDSPNAPNTGFYQLKQKDRDSPLVKRKLDNQQSPHHTKDEPVKKKTKETSVTATPPQKLSRKDESKSKIKKIAAKQKSKPFAKLMDDVVFVMSGYQNPQRSNLRDSLISMGAIYNADWEKGCTHLICAFRNTPKFKEVKGKGKIVNEKWVEDCYQKKIRLPWRRYSLEKNRNDEESEEEIWATEICPQENNGKMSATSKEEASNTDPMDDSSEDTDDEIQRALGNKSKESEKKSDTPKQMDSPSKRLEKNLNSTSDDDYDADTDVDEEPVKKDTASLSLPPLNDIFDGKTFFIYGSLAEEKRKSLKRYIVAYKGVVGDYMNGSVNFVLTEDAWDDNFDEALNNNSSLQFVKPQWIWKCINKEKMVPPQPFLVVPKDDS